MASKAIPNYLQYRHFTYTVYRSLFLNYRKKRDKNLIEVVIGPPVDTVLNNYLIEDQGYEAID